MVHTPVLWILSDDPDAHFCYEVVLGLRYQLKVFYSFNEFSAGLVELNEAGRAPPHLLVADLRGSEVSFLHDIGSLRSENKLGFPFIVASTVDDLDFIKRCLASGATDYIAKPFSKCEFIVRVEKILKQNLKHGPVVAEQASIVIDPASMVVRRNQLVSSSLTTKEFQIMVLLNQAALSASDNGYVTRAELVKRIWPNTKVGPKTINVHLVNLRKKLAPLGLEIRFTAPNSFALRG